MSKVSKDVLQIETVFDRSKDSSHSLIYSASIRKALQRLLPPDFFFTERSSTELYEELHRWLPALKWEEWGERSPYLSIFLLCRHRLNGVKFFYEMVSRWLLPGKRLSISSFFATDFKLPEVSEEIFTISEIVVSLEASVDVEQMRYQWAILENEIHLGLLSVYHANRILEIKGLSSDEKTSLIQERIISLLKRRPRDFDHDIFLEMQHFLVMCSDEFKAIREYAHMSKIICVFYLLVKRLRAQVESHPNQRFVFLKLSKAYLHLPFGLKKVLGIFLALNFLSPNEFFEFRHCEAVLKSHFPHLTLFEDSFFARTLKEEGIQQLYLEVEKEDKSDFSLEEMRQIKEALPEGIRNGVEKLTRPLFMPRNEEEVMRYIITLANQLKFSRDLPQVVIAFDTFTDVELSFTVIWLRVLKTEDLSLQQQWERSESFIKFTADRIRKVGMLRNRYPKEATVFRVSFSAHPFLRQDQSVDLFKARHALVQELHKIFGEFRDYNGGMIAKQHEQFLSLKGLFPSLDRKEELLLENFFHSIFPIEMRSLFNPLLLKKLFDGLLEVLQKKQKVWGFCHLVDNACYLWLSQDVPQLKENIAEVIYSLQIPDSQFIVVELHCVEPAYLGYIYVEEDFERRQNFVQKLQNLTFEAQTSYQ